jgi:hypothetical protein
LFYDGSETTFVHANTALDADFGVDHIGFLNDAMDGSHWTDAGTQGATDTFFRIDNEVEQILTGTGRTFIVINMGEVFIFKIFQSR